MRRQSWRAQGGAVGGRKAVIGRGPIGLSIFQLRGVELELLLFDGFSVSVWRTPPSRWAIEGARNLQGATSSARRTFLIALYLESAQS